MILPAIGQAGQLLNQKQYDAAAKVLQEALPDAANLRSTRSIPAMRFSISRSGRCRRSRSGARVRSRHDQNDFRKEFLRRVAFADETFTGSRQRGALTDRRRVFVLIGPLVVIRQKPLTARESTTRIGGSHGIPDAEAVFKFITQEGYGDHVLQRDFMVTKVLADAATMH